MKHLQALIGLQLFKSWNVYATRMFYFAGDELKESNHDGEYRLTLECPWRIERGGTIVTGKDDYGIRGVNNTDSDWNPLESQLGHLQDERLVDIFGAIRRGCIYNTTGRLIVRRVQADRLGGFRISLSGGFVLAVFPSSSGEMEWLLSRHKHGILSLNEGRLFEGY